MSRRRDRTARSLLGSSERVPAFYEHRRRAYEPQPLGFFRRFDPLKDEFDVDQIILAKHLAESVEEDAPVWAAVNVPERHAEGWS